MSNKFPIRELVPADSSALARLSLDSPDTGAIELALEYLMDAYDVIHALNPGSLGVVAETPDFDGLIGSGMLKLSSASFEGQQRPIALLNSLMVHPDYRRQGLATQLAQWRVDQAQERVGDEGVIIAYIQKGNTGSQQTAQKWCHQQTGKFILALAKVRQKPPQTIPTITIRPATPADYAVIVENLNRFYSDYNLYEEQTVEHLTTWLNHPIGNDPFRHYWVAVDQENTIVAGAAIIEYHKLFQLRVTTMPMAMRWVNKVIRLIPTNGILRSIMLEHVWFAPDQLAAGQLLWDQISYEWRNQADQVSFTYDPRSPLAQLPRLPFWMPQAELSLAIRAPVPVSEERLFCVTLA